MISNDVSFAMQIKSMNQAKGERKERCLEVLKYKIMPPQRDAMSYFSKAHKLHAASVTTSRCSVCPTAIVTLFIIRGEEDEEKV